MNTRDKDKTSSFTLVFRGDIRDFKQDPLTTETPWGIPYAVSTGDAIAEAGYLRRELDAVEHDE